MTQDLASCYANVDGPGWVEERIEVCDETLARIDPTWACFHCLSNEKAEALLDDGRGEDALAFLAEQEKKIPPPARRYSTASWRCAWRSC